MSKLRVLVWCPHIAPGGGERLLKRLVPAIARNDQVEMVRVALPAGTPAEAALKAQSPAPQLWGLDPKRLTLLPDFLQTEGRVLGIRGTGRLRSLARGVSLRRRARWERAQARKASRDCDLVYVFWPHHHYALSLNVPVVCTFHDATLFDFPEIVGKTKTRWEWLLSEAWLDRSTQMVFPSEATKSRMVALFGERCLSARVISHAILPDDPDAGTRTSAFAEALPEKYVVMPSPPSAHKGHYNLLLAWARFSKRRDFPLVLIGGGTEAIRTDRYPEYWVYEHLAGALTRGGLMPGVDYFPLGRVPEADLMPVIRRASALIMPTMSEGGGSYPVEEALSVGVPVLTSDIPVMREHLSGWSTPVAWFDPESVSSIVAALEDMFGRYEYYKEGAVQGMSSLRPSWDDVAASYVDLFQHVLETSRARSA